MEVPRAILDEFGDELEALTGAAREMALSAVGRAAAALAGEDGLVPEENVAALRRAVSDALDAVCAWAASSAAARAAEFYAAVSEAQGAGGRFEPHAADGRDPAATYGAVRALVESVRATGDASALAAALADRADYEARRAAFECMRGNAAADLRCVRFARVPSGRETCPFCLMLASFGFLPKGDRADPHVHAHCDCRIVPDFGGCSVEGYDPDGMYERYGMCLDSLGGRDGVRREWEAMPKAERDAYVERHGEKAGRAFDAFLNKRMAAEIGRRDPEWFRTGKAPGYSAEPGAKPDRFEKQCGAILRANGFPVDFRKPAGACQGGYKKRTSDVFIGKTPWEMKNPEGNNDKTVKNQLKKAVGMAQKEMQSSRVIISNVRSGRSAGQMAEDAKKLFADGRFIEIDEILVVGSDGTVLRIKRRSR